MKGKEQIAILGCGWLGLPLGMRLKAEGYRVKGSTTSTEKVPVLKAEGIISHKIELGKEEDRLALHSFLKDTEVLIITLPPNRKIDYYGAMEELVKGIITFNVPKVLFISSTSVYEDAAHFPEYSEKDFPTGQKGNAELLRRTEALLQDSSGFEASILRLGGLLGPGRHPVIYLAGRKDIANPEAPVNLVHQEDCINAISQVIEKNRFGEDFNVVYPFHPSRKEYYTREAIKRNLQAPQFLDAPSIGKIISSKKIIQELDFHFEKDITLEL